MHNYYWLLQLLVWRNLDSILENDFNFKEVVVLRRTTMIISQALRDFFISNKIKINLE